MAGNCEKCQLRKKYDAKPKSILGRLWRWHINWCPGWKAHYKSLPEPERVAVTSRYSLKGKKWEKA